MPTFVSVGDVVLLERHYRDKFGTVKCVPLCELSSCGAFTVFQMVSCAKVNKNCPQAGFWNNIMITVSISLTVFLFP